MDYLYALQSFRESCPALLNYFFLFISEVVVKCGVALTAIIFWCFSKHDGLVIGFGYVFSYSINQTVKNIACIPRPWLLDSRLHVDPIAESGATGFSFPSGHSVTAASVFGGLAVWQKKRRWLIVFSSITILLTAFSRNWLGCHTLKDVVVAVIIAGIVLCSLNIFVLWFSNHQDKDILVCVVGCLLSFAILIILQIKPYAVENVYPLITDCYTACGMTTGMLLGWLLERRFVNFSLDVSAKTKVLRGVIGGIIVVAIYLCGGMIFSFLGPHFSHLVKYFLIFFIIICLYPLAFTTVERHKK